MSLSASDGPIRSQVAVSGNVYFPQWPPFLRLPDGFAAPGGTLFVAAMFFGLTLYLSLAVIVLAVGVGWHALGRSWNALRRSALGAAVLGRGAD